MEYLNPTSIAGMFQTPKDTSIPGAGYGLSQGFLDAQAANQAMDFLDMAKSRAAQDYVKTQFENQKAFADRPFEIEKRNVELNKTRGDVRATQLSNKKMEDVIAELQRSKQWEGARTFGSAAESFKKAGNPIERKMIWDSYVRRHQMLGLPVDELINWDGSEEGWQNIIRQSELARDLSSYQDQIAAQRAMTTEKEAGDTSRTQATLTSKEKRATEDNATAIEVAKIKASIERATNSGGNAYNQEKANLLTRYNNAIAKQQRGEQLNADEQAAIIIGPQILSTGFASTEYKSDPGLIQRQSRAKASGELQGVREGLKSGSTQTPQDVTGEQDLQNRLRRYVQ